MDHALTEAVAADAEEGFWMANLRPERTGLPFVVFISQQGGARHDVRVKVARGPRARPEEMVSVTIRPVPRVVPPGELSAGEFALLERWLALNAAVLVAFWDGEIAYTEDALATLRPLAREQAMDQPAPETVGVPYFDDDMFDMMNLSREDTGIDGVVYVSTAQGAHGPRVKWYPGRPGYDAPCLSVTLQRPPRVINHGLPIGTIRQAEPMVVGWVDGNRAALLEFWEHGLSWTRHEVNAFIAALRRSG